MKGEGDALNAPNVRNFVHQCKSTSLLDGISPRNQRATDFHRAPVEQPGPAQLHGVMTAPRTSRAWISWKLTGFVPSDPLFTAKKTFEPIPAQTGKGTFPEALVKKVCGGPT